MIPEIEARLQGFGISLMSEGASFSVFLRDRCVAMVGRTQDGALSLGSTGMMTEKGLAYLVWRDGQPFLAAKGGDVAADPVQVEAIRKFSEDLRTALQLTA